MTTAAAGQPRILVEARVVRLGATERGEAGGAGLEFLTFKGRGRQRLHTFLTQHLD